MLKQLRSPISPKTRDAALLCFVLAAISAAMTMICFVEMKNAADLSNVPPLGPGRVELCLVTKPNRP